MFARTGDIVQLPNGDKKLIQDHTLHYYESFGGVRAFWVGLVVEQAHPQGPKVQRWIPTEGLAVVSAA